MALKEIYEQKSNEELLERYKDYNNYRDDVKSIILEELKKRGLISDEEIEKKLKAIKKIGNSINSEDNLKKEEKKINEFVQRNYINNRNYDVKKKGDYIRKKAIIDKEDEITRVDKILINSLISLSFLIVFVSKFSGSIGGAIWEISVEIILLNFIIFVVLSSCNKKNSMKTLKVSIVIALLLVSTWNIRNFIIVSHNKKEIKSYIQVKATILEYELGEDNIKSLNVSTIRIKYKFYLNGKEYIRVWKDSTPGKYEYKEKEKVGSTFIILVNPIDAERFWYDKEQFFRK